ncbi:MAG: ATP-binding protein [Fibrobacterota bacterium]
MRERRSKIFLDFRENKGRWLLFFMALTLIAGTGVVHYRAEERAGRLYAEAVRCRLEASRDVTEACDWLDALEVPYVVVTPQNEPVVWNRIRYPGYFFFPGELVLPGDSSFSAQKALQDRVEDFRASQPPLFINPAFRQGKTLRVYYLLSAWVRYFPLFPAAEIFILVMFTITFYMGIKNRDLVKQAHLWIGFAKETAHQLGTPISSLYGWIEMMRLRLTGKSGLDPEMDSLLCEASEDVKKLNKRFLRFLQIGTVPTLAPGDLNEVAREMIAYFRERLPQSERTIQIVANHGELPPVLLNKDLMGWVLENLMKNAMDAIEKKEGVIEIETRHLVREGRIRLTHTDNGHGIRKENLKRIFDPGFSTKKHGWGLGLALARRIVADYHFGRIYVESTVTGRGTTFVVELPVAKMEARP